MTKQEIQSILSGVPESLKTATPETLKSYFELNYEELSESEINNLTAFYLVQNLNGREHFQNTTSALSTIKHGLAQKYSELGGSPDHPLWPFIEVAAIAVTRNKFAIVFS